MNDNERSLSEYIDSLNKEQKPKAHDPKGNSPELEKLYDTVRLVRSLKEPAMPDDSFQQKLTHAVEVQLLRKKPIKSRKKSWFVGFAAVAAALVMIIAINNILPLKNTNIVYAMTQAFQEVKAYHGIIEIAENTGKGSSSAQAKLEVWADKQGHYYVKELEGSQKGLITLNNGVKKWQIRPDEKQVYIFPAFPDPYLFTFELGKEVKEVNDALSTKIVGEDAIAGRQCSIVEVSPKGGAPYQIWIDKSTKLPLQKQYAVQNAIQYKITYTNIDFVDSIPAEVTAYNPPKNFKEINNSHEQIVSNLDEASTVAGFTPKTIETLPDGYVKDSIAIDTNKKVVKQYYASQDKEKKVVILQGKSADKFKPAPTAVLGKVNGSNAEIMSPVEESPGILGGGGLYSGVTNIRSIRWLSSGFEYTVVGNTSLEDLASFVKNLTNETVEIPLLHNEADIKPQIEVLFDLSIEENEQKSVDAGHSPWKLDPAFVAQVFVSLKIYPEGIKGEYPVKYEDLKIVRNDGKTAVIEVKGDKTPVKNVYLKRLVRQDSTGIWTVVGYDPADKK